MSQGEGEASRREETLCRCIGIYTHVCMYSKLSMQGPVLAGVCVIQGY